MDYNQNNELNSFAVASMVCGILSVTLCCTGILALPLGALGILFAVLSKRLDTPLTPFSITGIILSSIGLLLGIIICVCMLIEPVAGSEYQKDVPDNNHFFDYDKEYENFYNYGFEDL